MSLIIIEVIQFCLPPRETNPIVLICVQESITKSQKGAKLCNVLKVSCNAINYSLAILARWLHGEILHRVAKVTPPLVP
jgi:hypothetical protein